MQANNYDKVRNQRILQNICFQNVRSISLPGQNYDQLEILGYLSIVKSCKLSVAVTPRQFFISKIPISTSNNVGM